MKFRLDVIRPDQTDECHNMTSHGIPRIGEQIVMLFEPDMGMTKPEITFEVTNVIWFAIDGWEIGKAIPVPIVEVKEIPKEVP